jgi:gliding motility-associated-like protein
LSILDVLTSTTFVDICQGQSVILPDGTSVSAAGSYDVTLVSSFGCDSVVTTIVSINNILTSTTFVDICQGQSVILPDGTSVSAAGSYDVTLVSSFGCDSVVTTIVSINNILTSTTFVDICQGQSVILPDGTSVSAAGSYDVTLVSSFGCDSVVTTIVSINNILTSTTFVDICQGQSVILPDGTSVSAAGSYDVTLVSSFGCDSVVTTIVSINNILTSTTFVDICQGQSVVLPDGTSVSAAGSYDVTLVSSFGCDSVVTTIVSINNILTSTTFVDICQGQSVILPDGTSVSAAGSYDVTLVSSFGCDSVVTTIVSINNILTSTTFVDICQGQSVILPDGTSVSAAGSYDVTLVSSFGCDSVVTTIVSINNILTSTTFVDICQGQSVILPDGTSVSAAGSYDVTLVSSFGCDSVVTTIVSINNILTSTTFVDICQGQSVILPDGTSVSAAGSYDVTLVSSFGCDSVVTTVVSILDVLTSTTFVDICQGQSVILPDGTSVSAAGSYDVTLVSSFGCDSVVTTIVSINNILTSTTFVDICQGQSVILPDGTSVSAAGSYDVTLVSSFGCDSVVTTVVSILDVLTSTTFVDICQGQSVILPDGTSVSAAGSYDVTLVSSFGCDSVVTTIVSINNILTSTTFVDICQGQSVILPDGTSVSAAGSYDVTLVSSFGCDSVVTTIVSINNILTSTTFVDICQGQSVILPDGTSVSAAGSYDVTLVSSFGCDSVVTTIVSINNILTSTTFVDICQGQSVILPDGTSVSAAGSYDVTLVSSFGCDSVVTTIVSINNILTSTTFVDICQGQSVILPDGTSVSAAGSYDVTLVSSFGCDSVVTTVVSILDVLTSTTFVDICQGQSVILPDGTSVSAAGSYDVTLVSSFGCDSVVTTIVSINNILTSTTFVDICQGQSVILPDGTSVSAAGSYDVTLVSSFGCDSVVTTIVSINNILTSTTFVDICQGQSVVLPDGTSVSAAGSYNVTLVSTGGCDSIVTTIVSLFDLVAVNGLLEECQTGGQFYIVSFEISGGDASSYTVSGLNGTLTPGNPAIFVSDPIAQGTAYNFTVSDINACNSVNLFGNVACECPVTAQISGDNSICFGSQTELIFNFSGQGPYEVEYTDGTSNFVLSGIEDGHSIWVNPSYNTTYGLISVSDVFCSGTVSGSAVVSVVLPPDAGLDGAITLCANEPAVDLFGLLGGTPDANGQWISPLGFNTSSSFNPAINPEGDYTYLVDGGLCPDESALVSVMINPLPIAAIEGNASICDGNTANLVIDLEGSGSWTVIYAIDGVQQPPVNAIDTELIIETLQEGSYTIVSVTDEFCAGNGMGMGLVQINESPTAVLSGQGDICPGGEASLSIDLTGAPGYNVLYSIDGVLQDPLFINQNNFTITTSLPGIYQLISVADSNCPGSPVGTAVVGLLPTPVATLSGGGTICPGDSALVNIDFTGFGNITTVYSNGASQQTITAQQGSFNFYVNQNADFSLISVLDAQCPGSTYGTASVAVSEFPQAFISGGGVICAGESADITFDLLGEGPFTIIYSINGVVQQPLVSSDASATLSFAAAGVFELLGVTDSYCENLASGSVAVSINNLPSGFMSGGAEICDGDFAEIQIEFTGSGNWNFVYAVNGEPVPAINTSFSPFLIETGLEGSYELISVTDDNCPGIANGDAVVDVNELPMAILSGVGAICAGQAAELTLDLAGVGPWQVIYAIDGVEQAPLVVNASPYVLSTSQTGTYTLVAVADQNCIGNIQGSAVVANYPLPTAMIVGNAVICPDETATFEIITSGNGPWQVIYSIDGVPQPPVTVTTSPFELTVNAPGIYQIVSVEDAFCANSGFGTPALLSYASFPSAQMVGGGTFCPGELGDVAILFQGQAPWTFVYSINGVMYGPITTSSNTYTLFDGVPGNYQLISVSDASCNGSVQGQAAVGFYSSPVASVSPGGTVCPGEFFELSATGTQGIPPYSFVWHNINDESWTDSGSDISVLPVVSSGYYVTITDGCGTTSLSDTAWIDVANTPLASFHFYPNQNITIHDTEIDFNSSTSLFAFSMNWEFFEFDDYQQLTLLGSSYQPNPSFTFPDDGPGNYLACLYITSIDNCPDQVCLEIEIDGDFIVYVPNAFTPNGDGINDLFGPVMEGHDPSSFEFFIVNRWGETVFYTKDTNQKWNGSGMNGDYYAPDGVYAWRIKVKQIGGTDKEEFTGHVTLVR